ncbi:MAG: protoporphyrinogen oxidase, partial [Planctomycetes bacterium]|nr:protoporphyrinogen oxidase [Planctomycetota bacterium]
MNHIVVVGAGVSGLATAYHIRRLAADRGTELRVTVLEASSRVGGRVWTDRAGGFQIEAGASGFLDSKRSTLNLCADLELDSELTASRPQAKTRYLLWHDRLQKLPTGPGELLRSGLLSWRGKLRLLLEAFVPSRSNDDDISVYDLACRRIGREATEVLVGAAVSGIHAGDSRLLSAPAAFPRMVEIERNYGSLIRAMPRLWRQRLAEAAARAIAMTPEAAQSPAPASPSGPAEASPQGNASQQIRGTGPGGVLWSLRGGMGQLVERLAERCVAEIIRGVNVRA